MTRAWDHRRFGTIDDPIHKSHLNDIAGPYGCLQAFEFDQRAGDDGDANEDFASGIAAAGTATHETLNRAVTSDNIFPGGVVTPVTVGLKSIARVYDEEFARAVDGREVAWRRKDKPERVRQARLEMIAGVLYDLHHHVAEVVSSERAWIAQLGDYWIAGHIDLLYRPRDEPNALGEADWKTGAQLPAQIVLDHGFEAGLYAQACKAGLFIDRAELTWTWDDVTKRWTAEHAETGIEATHRTRFWAERHCLERALIAKAKAVVADGYRVEDFATFGEFPSELRYVHLPDYGLYQKETTKSPQRPEQLAFYGIDRGQSVKCQAGHRRGPGWYKIRRTAHDVVRLETLVRKLVGVVRLGRFFESIDEKCKRCRHYTPCLTSGYELRGENAKRAQQILNVLPPGAV